MKTLLIISATASPHQVRFVPFLAKYFNVQHYFYDRVSRIRQSFWRVELGERCHLLPCKFKWHAKYITVSVLRILRREKPDILLLGSFSIPSNYIAYLWARWHHVPVVVFTERSRNRKGALRSYGVVWRLLHFLYRNVTRVMVTAEDIVPQFRDNFHFGDKVIAGRYPTDIDQYFNHPVRVQKDYYTIIFPNRMTDIYNPIAAVEIFSEVRKRYPKTRLKMNASGELRPDVEKRISELGIFDSVEFLDRIRSWDELSDIYASCDIMLLPAKFSNGNYTISECAASGMGVVVSDRILGSSIADMRKAGTGFILPLDKQLFVKKICWYIENPDAFAREAAINRRQLHYLTHEATAKFYYELLADL